MSMEVLTGMKIVESPYITEVPKLQLSYDFTACSDVARQVFNSWLRETFGTYLPCYVLDGNTVVMHPRHVAALRVQGKVI